MRMLLQLLFLSAMSAQALVACGSSSAPAKDAGAPVEVAVTEARLEQQVATERVPGSVRSKMDATIEAKVSGKIAKVLVREGDSVKEGQLLAELDAPELLARLDQAQASLRQAEQDMKRFAQLLPSGAITKRDYEDAETRARVGNASVDEARTMVGYTQIKAPFDGVVTQKLVEPGDLAMPGRPLVRIERGDSFRFEADVPETLTSALKVNLPLSVRLAGMDNDLNSSVAEISPTTDMNSRTLHIKLDLPTVSLLRSGQFGYALVPIAQRPVMRIPLSAVVRRGQIEAVYVASEDRALLRLVRIGKQDKDSAEILSGLSSGEKVIVSDVQKLKDGALITPSREPQSAPQGDQNHE